MVIETLVGICILLVIGVFYWMYAISTDDKDVEIYHEEIPEESEDIIDVRYQDPNDFQVDELELPQEELEELKQEYYKSHRRSETTVSTVIESTPKKKAPVLRKKKRAKQK